MASPSEQSQGADVQSEILVYATERVQITPPEQPIKVGSASLHFERYDTSVRFQEYDGVILFQGVFEHFERKSGLMDTYLAHKYDRNELDKRKKEAALLVRNGGFICFILVRPFIDREDGRSFQSTDLAKFHLNYSDFHRENFANRVAYLRVKRDEFRLFLDLYGAASTHFRHYNDHIEWHIISEARGNVCGMVINRLEYFIPSLLPDNRPDVVSDYFSKLTTAILTTKGKLDLTVPSWVCELEFEEEETLQEELSSLETKIRDVNNELHRLETFKGIVVWSGDQLVEGVAIVFSDGFGFSTDATDEFREDLKILNDTGEAWCLCEVKGVNRGVKREHINQADSHRERSGFEKNFPALLIVNVSMKGAPNLSARDEPIAEEQIRHARNMNILIVRTIDLLRLLRLFKLEQISSEAIMQLFSSSRGWLNVSESGWSVELGNSEP